MGLDAMTKENWIKFGVWLIPVVFAAGSLYYQQMQTSSAATANKEHIHNHERLPAHPVIEQRVKVLEEDRQEMIMEQRTIRTEQSRAAENISAICQATNANCR
jgi:hypothetical protein